MNQFLSSFLKFIFPFLLLIVGIEMYVIYYPSTFNVKAKYLHANAATTELLILGSSHNQNALNPEYLNLKAVNLANASQDLQIDAALFFKYVPRMQKLRLVILELDYFTLEEKNDKENFRLPWYKRFFGVELYPISFYNRISLYASSPSFFNKVLIDALNPKKTKYKINEFGFITNDFPGVMVDEKYDSLKIAATAPDRLKGKHTAVSLDNLHFNLSRLNSMINYCSKNNIAVILLAAPMYSTYIKNEVPEKNQRKAAYLDSLRNSNPAVKYYSYESDPRFLITDFKNDDHLNSNGARKYSKIIDSLTLSILATY
ncbi:MAG: hypothetical protein EOO06_01305 [Chitinophagaceae bacterium]|nr:MAG: hypothetical protein EOO06_01305 [Chitinophagaceae bacterium]